MSKDTEFIPEGKDSKINYFANFIAYRRFLIKAKSASPTYYANLYSFYNHRVFKGLPSAATAPTNAESAHTVDPVEEALRQMTLADTGSSLFYFFWLKSIILTLISDSPSDERLSTSIVHPIQTSSEIPVTGQNSSGSQPPPTPATNFTAADEESELSEAETFPSAPAANSQLLKDQRGKRGNGRGGRGSRGRGGQHGGTAASNPAAALSEVPVASENVQEPRTRNTRSRAQR